MKQSNTYTGCLASLGHYEFVFCVQGNSRFGTKITVIIEFMNDNSW